MAALSTVLVSLLAAVAAQTSSNTAVVNLSNNTGAPQHLAAGILYGIPDTTGQIPSSYYTDIGLNYFRGGGAQVPAPGRGWIWNEYNARFASALSDYKTARSYGMKVIFLIHDLWGADGTQNSSAPYPGDNGDWTSWDAYLNRFISDVNANGMTDGLIIDIWNEPDLTYFWNRDQNQYLQMWGRTYQRFRNAWGTNVLLSGPAAANTPSTSSTWWSNYMSYIASNGTVPDQWAWHMEGGGGDMLSATGGLYALLSKYNLPAKPININEYAIFAEEVPAGSTWFIAQLERVNAHGLRGNWLSGWALHDFLASLVSKPANPDTTYSATSTGYYPNGDWQLYKYYYQSMTGSRIGTSPSGDNKLDVYATVDSSKVRLLAGVRITTGTWYITVKNLSAVGLPTSGTLNIQTYGFPVGSDVHYSEVDGPTNLGVVGHTYSGDSVTFAVYQTDKTTAYAFEFSV